MLLLSYGYNPSLYSGHSFRIEAAAAAAAAAASRRRRPAAAAA